MAYSAEPGASTVILAETKIVQIAGADRQTFLQGQLTQDVGRASETATVLAGWADAKGRLLWAGHLFARADTLCVMTSGALADALVRRLRMFVLRAKVEVTTSDGIVVGLMDHGTGALPPSGYQLLDMAGDSSRHLLIGPASAAFDVHAARGLHPATAAGWTLRDIRAGLPEVTPVTSGEFVPQMVNLDLLDGISFTKGCYTGQEIVARTKYRGHIKRRMLRFGLAGAPPACGDPVYGARGVVGQVVSAEAADNGGELLAVVSLDDLPGALFADAAHAVPLHPLPLPYAIPELAG